MLKRDGDGETVNRNRYVRREVIDRDKGYTRIEREQSLAV